MSRDHSVIFETAPNYCISDSFVDYEGYFISSKGFLPIVQFGSVQSLSRVQLFATPWTAACQASLSNTNSWSLHKLMSIESVMPSNHLILCRHLLLLPSIFSNSGSFQMSQLFASGGQNIGASASASVLPMDIQGWFFRIDWLDLFSFPWQTIQYDSNPSLCPNQYCRRSWSWMVLWWPTRPSRTNTKKMFFSSQGTGMQR